MVNITIGPQTLVIMEDDAGTDLVRLQIKNNEGHLDRIALQRCLSEKLKEPTYYGATPAQLAQVLERMQKYDEYVQRQKNQIHDEFGE